MKLLFKLEITGINKRIRNCMRNWLRRLSHKEALLYGKDQLSGIISLRGQFWDCPYFIHPLLTSGYELIHVPMTF